jgi:hypothetical protein
MLCGYAGAHAENIGIVSLRFLCLMIIWLIWFLCLYIEDDAE